MNVNDWQHRRAIYALLASEISLYRWFVAGAVLCALASVCAAYLFPLEADNLLMWNLGVLVTHALLAGYVATTFERDGVLSNILCNRPKKAEFSASLSCMPRCRSWRLDLRSPCRRCPAWSIGVAACLRCWEPSVCRCRPLSKPSPTVFRMSLLRRVMPRGG